MNTNLTRKNRRSKRRSCALCSPSQNALARFPGYGLASASSKMKMVISIVRSDILNGFLTDAVALYLNVDHGRLLHLIRGLQAYPQPVIRRQNCT
jgi:hypothetical protein